MRLTTLVCLPFAGGNQTSYAFLRQYLPAQIPLLALDYPGHGRRMGTPPLQDLEAIVSDVVEQVRQQLAGEYVLFGHSMGACVAFLAAERLADSWLAPRHLFLSGHAAITQRKSTRRHLLPRDAFLALVAELQGTPDEVLACPELVELLEPVLRADFAALENYQRTDFAPLPYPVTLLHGGDDPSVSRQSIAAWREICPNIVSCEEFPGGHFFIHQHAAQVAALIAGTVASP